jgi:hemoglobin
MSESVYSQIGGEDAVEQVVDDFYDRVLADDDLADFFEGMDMAELRAHQVQFISAVTGGPVEYAGADMRAAHDHLDISDGEFDLVGTYLEQALRDAGVEDQNVSAIMSEVVALKPPIVGN